MAINTEKLVKLSQFQTGLQRAKGYTDAQIAAVNAEVAKKALAADLTAEVTRAKAAEEAALKAGTDAQAAVDALGQKVGDLPEGQADVIAYINDKTSGIATDTALQELNGKVSTLVGSDAGKSARTIANEELAAQLVADGAKESLDTLAEIAAWIQSHPDDASAMNEAITALQNKVDTGDKTVSAYVADAITALKIGDYAKAADLTALAGRVTTAEGNITSLQGNKADKATTLAGYGITDAYTKTDADAKTKEIIASEVIINVASDEEVAAVCTTVFGA